jgi:ribosome maturation factor RimP
VCGFKDMKKSLEELETKIKEAMVKEDIIVDSVTYEKNSGNYYVLSVVLDKVGGIDLDTIVDATNIINPIVDKYDFTDDSYILDVVSKERGESNE